MILIFRGGPGGGPSLGNGDRPASIAAHWRHCHNAIVAVQITIRGVPEDVRDRLALRAARQRRSMQGFLRGELERIASRPSVEEWLQQVREHKKAAGTRVAPSAILRARDADRR